jgi:hypothetical protein
MYYIEEKIIKLKELFMQNDFFRYLIIIGCAAAIFCLFNYGGKEVGKTKSHIQKQ